MAKAHYDYAGDILTNRFGEIAELIRNGDVSALDKTARNLLADYLEGNLKKSKGRPHKRDSYETAEYYFHEYDKLRREGMKRTEALKILAGRFPEDNIDTKRIEQHIANFRVYAEKEDRDKGIGYLSMNYGHQILLKYQNKCIDGSTHEEAVRFIAESYGVENSEAESLVGWAEADSKQST